MGVAWPSDRAAHSGMSVGHGGTIGFASGASRARAGRHIRGAAVDGGHGQQWA